MKSFPLTWSRAGKPDETFNATNIQNFPKSRPGGDGTAKVTFDDEHGNSREIATGKVTIVNEAHAATSEFDLDAENAGAEASPAPKPAVRDEDED